MKTLLSLIFLVLTASCTDKSMNNNIDIQGHRGCRGLMPENTIEGFKKALDLGVPTLELDLSVNGDGEIIVSHEPFFNHEISTGPDALIITEEIEKQHNTFQLSQAEIENYDVGLKPHPRFPFQMKMKAKKPLLTTMVKLVEAYAAEKKHPAPKYNMEIKRHPMSDGIYHPVMEVFADKVVSTIDSLEITERTTVQCFDTETLIYLHKKHNHKKLVYLIENKDGVEVNIAKLGFVPYIYSPHYKLVTKDLVQYCKHNKMKLIPWTVNEAADTEHLIALGVDGIISDFPDMVIEVAESLK